MLPPTARFLRVVREADGEELEDLACFSRPAERAGAAASERGYLAPMIDDEKKAELDEHLSELHAELGELARTDAHRARTVAGFAELSAHEAARPRPNRELLGISLSGLKKSVQELEQTHPRLVEVVGSLASVLSNVGL